MTGAAVARDVDVKEGGGRRVGVAVGADNAAVSADNGAADDGARDDCIESGDDERSVYSISSSRSDHRLCAVFWFDPSISMSSSSESTRLTTSGRLVTRNAGTAGTLKSPALSSRELLVLARVDMDGTVSDCRTSESEAPSGILLKKRSAKN